jgi:hypothetical protein
MVTRHGFISRFAHDTPFAAVFSPEDGRNASRSARNSGVSHAD